MELIEYPDAEMMMLDLADRIASELRMILSHEDSASLSVPGGTTPGPVFDSLCAADLDWDRVRVFLNDERWVTEDNPRSNTALIRQRLLTDRASVAQYLPLFSGHATPEEGIPTLTPAIEQNLPISVLLLGMGTDMHTASIFPGADRLDDALHGREVLLPMRADGAPEPRITLSARVLNGALNRHVLITGSEKRTALDRAVGLSPEEAPVAAILKGSTIHWAEN